MVSLSRPPSAREAQARPSGTPGSESTDPSAPEASSAAAPSSLSGSIPISAAGSNPKGVSAENLPPTSGGVRTTALQSLSQASRSRGVPGSVRATKRRPSPPVDAQKVR